MSFVENKILKGFANLRAFAVLANLRQSYGVGAPVDLTNVAAQSLTQADTRQDYTIPGDDGTAAKGSDYQSTQLVITVARMWLDKLAALTGAEFDEESHEYSDAELDNAPELALTFSGLLEDGGYRLFRYYSCKLSSYKVDLTTKPSNQNGSLYQLTFNCSGRLCDPKHKIRTFTDVVPDEEGEVDLTWLETIPNIGGPITVTYVGGEGATGTPPTQAAMFAGQTFPAAANPFVKSDNHFTGWLSSAGGTHAAGATVTVPATALTLTAQWEAD